MITSRAPWSTFSFSFDCVAACRVFACRVCDAIVDDGLDAGNIVDSAGAGVLSVDVDVAELNLPTLGALAASVRAEIVL
jgi:hypothetical protein